MPILAAFVFFLAIAPLLALGLLGAPGVSTLLANPIWQAAILRTLDLAARSAPLALLLGFAEALLLCVTPRRARPFLLVLFGLPLLVPLAPLLPAIGRWADQAGAGPRALALIAAHALPAAVPAFLLIFVGLRRIDPCLLGSVRAAGGTMFAAFCLVIWQEFWPAMVAGAAGASAASIALIMADTALAAAFHPTLGAMLTVAVQTADAQTAPAGLVLAALAIVPLVLLGCVSPSRLYRATRAK
jgi:ABC-type spermidine/putrescine transport system permease subunit II